MNRHARARSLKGIVDALAKVGIAAVYDHDAGGFLLMKKGASGFDDDVWQRALQAPLLVLTEEELDSPQCCEIAWRKASHLLHVDGH